MRLKRVYIEDNEGGGIDKEVFRYDYIPSLDAQMHRDAYGFWHSYGLEITLQRNKPNSVFYKKSMRETEATDGMLPLDMNIRLLRLKANDRGLEVLLIHCADAVLSPAIVICLGGPVIPLPDFTSPDSIYMHFVRQGFALIVPIRRGISGISPAWEKALEGHYGEYDVEDTVEATDYVLSFCPGVIDSRNVFLYGGSYGGYVAELIAGKANRAERFKAIIAHCGIYDLSLYPWHCLGIPSETMLTYGGTSDELLYAKRVMGISPKTFAAMWNVPVLLVHHLYDTSAWVGQSVAAYNDAIKHKKDVRLLIVPAPHTYDISNKEVLFYLMSSFFSDCMSQCSKVQGRQAIE